MNSSFVEIEQKAATGDIAAQLLLAASLSAEGKDESAELWLRRAAKTGNLEAQMELGRYLLSRPPPVPESVIDEGTNLVVSAAHAGYGEASRLVSLMAAVNPTLDDNWKISLIYLGRAAKSGYVPAQVELAFLADDRDAIAALQKGETLAPETCHRLHDAVDLAEWTKVPKTKNVSVSPEISIVEGMIPPRLCDWIILRAYPKLQRALTYNPLDGKSRTVTERTNSDMSFPFHELDFAMISVLYRIGKIIGLPIKGMEKTSVMHYAVGEEFRPHHDFLDPDIASFRAEIAAKGQRLMTFLIYLNDDFDGGETDFPDIGYRFKGRKGDAILFRNTDSSGAPDYRTLHAGLAPTRGEKWLLSQWIRGEAPPAKSGATKPKRPLARTV